MARRVGGGSRGIAAPWLLDGLRAHRDRFVSITNLREHLDALVEQVEAGESVAFTAEYLWDLAYAAGADQEAEWFRRSITDPSTAFMYDPTSQSLTRLETSDVRE